MKKILLFSAVACMAFFACKKDSTPETQAPVTQETVKTIDPIALSAGVKIGYGATNAKGTIPVASSDANAPVLDILYNGRPYDAISNRYVVIYPRISAGYIAGYYLKINGADSYYKIDYKTAAGLRKAQPEHAFGLRENGDNGDSSIIVKLPDHLIGDTFSISYAAYDTLNRVSNTITAIVNVIASKDSTDDRKLIGNWSATRIKSNEDGEWQTFPNSQPSNYNSYNCIDGKLVWVQEETEITIPSEITNGEAIFAFAAKNLFTEGSHAVTTMLDIEKSSCSNYVYTATDSTNNQYVTGGYSYNAATKTITVINDANGTGSYITSQKMMVKELSATKLTLFLLPTYSSSHDEYNNVQYIEFNKK